MQIHVVCTVLVVTGMSMLIGSLPIRSRWVWDTRWKCHSAEEKHSGRSVSLWFVLRLS